jgi:hypothetical protein
MRLEVLHRTSARRPPRSLLVRGGLARTFGSLATFLVVTFFCSGIYILEDAFAHPLAAQAAALISGAFIIALATILLYYLIKPGNEPRVIRQDHPQHAALSSEQEVLEEISLSARRDDSGKDPASQRVYVDHSRIRL